MQIVQAKHNNRVTFSGYVLLTIGQHYKKGSYVSSSSPNRTRWAQGFVTLIIADSNPRGSGVTNPHHCRTEISWLRGILPTSLPIRTHVAQHLIARIIAEPNPHNLHTNRKSGSITVQNHPYSRQSTYNKSNSKSR